MKDAGSAGSAPTIPAQTPAVSSPGVTTAPLRMWMLRAYTAVAPGCFRKVSRTAGFASIHARVSGSSASTP
jgi:hypothetical protein